MWRYSRRGSCGGLGAATAATTLTSAYYKLVPCNSSVIAYPHIVLTRVTHPYATFGRICCNNCRLNFKRNGKNKDKIS